MKREWSTVDGISNMGEDYENISARKINDDTVQVAYMAFGGIKVVELTGVEDIVPIEDLMQTVIEKYGDDWEVAFAVKEPDGDVHIAAIDSCSDVHCVSDGVSCISGEEYDVDTLDELDEELLRLYDLV